MVQEDWSRLDTDCYMHCMTELVNGYFGVFKRH